MTLSMVNEAPEQFFKCAVSVAPVTNFAYYGRLATEKWKSMIEIFRCNLH